MSERHITVGLVRNEPPPPPPPYKFQREIMDERHKSRLLEDKEYAREYYESIKEE